MMIRFLLFLGMLNNSYPVVETKPPAAMVNPLSGDHNTTIDAIEKYFHQLADAPQMDQPKNSRLLRFSALATIGRVYLHGKKDPEGAIARFEKIRKSKTLTTAEQDIVDSWISGIREWIKFGKYPNQAKNSDDLFDTGKKYYESGLKKQKFLMDYAGAVDFNIAATYLVPFIVNYEKNSKNGDAMLMMGEIRRRTWYESKNWSEGFYLTEVIRRHPGSSLAMKAYQALDDDVHFMYSGSSGDHTPASWLELLRDFKSLAKAPPAFPTIELR